MPEIVNEDDTVYLEQIKEKQFQSVCILRQQVTSVVLLTLQEYICINSLTYEHQQ